MTDYLTIARECGAETGTGWVKFHSEAALTVFAERIRAERWIPVSERLPECDGLRCAVVAPGAANGDLWPTRWSAENQNFEAAFGWFERDEVTHWQPLPPPPAAIRADQAGGEG